MRSTAARSALLLGLTFAAARLGAQEAARMYALIYTYLLERLAGGATR